MCRFLLLYTSEPRDPTSTLEAFARVCRESSEYQGDGWGVAWLADEAWEVEKSESPIWTVAGWNVPPTRGLLVHARSAFEPHGRGLDLNMPFVDRSLAFAFNGEMRQVRLRVEGQSGAQRLHTLARRFRNEGATPGDALCRTADLVRSRSRVVRGMNMVWASPSRAWLTTDHQADHGYFTPWMGTGPGVAFLASEVVDTDGGVAWQPVEEGTRIELEAPR